jgi:hypothetical protein
MGCKLDVVRIPASDVDWAKRSSGEQVGFVFDVDTRTTDGPRFVQLTLTGFVCSVHLSARNLNVLLGVLAGSMPVVSTSRLPRRLICG